MECFRQIFRCFKAPFTRKQRGLEIGLPTDFRREELPTCFSDAESVLSPSQTTAERPTLTKQSQHVDVSGQPGSDSGEGRHGDRDGPSLAVVEDKDFKSSSNLENRGFTSRLRDRMRPYRWFNPGRVAAPEQ